MIRAGSVLLLATLLSFSGCRALHEGAIKQRLVQTRFFGRAVPLPLAEIDRWLVAHRAAPGRLWCELCLLSAQNVDGGRQYCLSSHEETACVIARGDGPSRTRFEAVEPQRTSAQVLRALWAVVEPDASLVADQLDAGELGALAYEEEEAFAPRWSFAVGAKVGSVISYDPITFTFGAHAGFRYWGSMFVVPGAVVEVENMLQASRSLVTSSLLGRVELTLWTDDNARFVNLPRVSFVMGAGPLIGFGRQPALGGRAVIGIHLIHLARFLTPFFFELGFQALEVDAQSSTGLRIALGLGF